MPEVGDLVRSTTGGWVTLAPARCPNGHELGAGQVIVGHAVCVGHGGGGHTTWTCLACDALVFGPQLAPHCSILDGPAAVRISNRYG